MIPMRTALIHEFGHVAVALAFGLRPTGVFWGTAVNRTSPLGTKELMILTDAKTCITGIYVTLNGIRCLDPQHCPALQRVSATGVAIELLSETNKLDDMMVIERFRHLDQSIDLSMLTEALGRTPTDSDLLFFVRDAARILRPARRRIVEEADSLVSDYTDMQFGSIPRSLAPELFDLLVKQLQHIALPDGDGVSGD